MTKIKIKEFFSFLVTCHENIFGNQKTLNNTCGLILAPALFKEAIFQFWGWKNIVFRKVLLPKYKPENRNI